MQTFRKMHLTVYKRDTGEGMVVLNASEPTVGDSEASSRDAGLRYLSFYFTVEEFEGLLTGKLSACTDIGHNVRVFGELFTFFDLEFPAETRGVSRVPFVNVHIPHYVGKILVRAVRAKLGECVPNGDRLEIDLPWSLRERWTRQYGCGTGQVRVEIAEGYPNASGPADFFAECEATGGDSFKERIENLKRIARNGTYRHTDVGTVALSKDGDGWYFRILSPTGRCSLNGGVINHGRDGKQDWSIHT